MNATAKRKQHKIDSGRVPFSVRQKKKNFLKIVIFSFVYGQLAVETKAKNLLLSKLQKK